MISIVACCHSAKLSALAARAFPITTMPNVAIRNVTVNTILPSRSTIKRKLDDKCKVVKANLAKEIQKAIANYGLEMSSHTVLVEENSIYLFGISYIFFFCLTFLCLTFLIMMKSVICFFY